MDSTTIYQRAVTPTIDTTNSASGIRGKVLSYQSQRQRTGKFSVDGTLLSATANNSRVLQQGQVYSARNSTLPSGPYLQQQTEINIQGRSAGRGATTTGSNNGNLRFSPSDQAEQANSIGNLLRYELIPLSEEIPSDGIIFARVRNHLDSLVVFRTPDERMRNPERLNLDRRQLEVCPILEQEQRLRLLNFQNNNIRSIQNLDNLPNLIFLDLYNNKLTSLDGPVSLVKGLRVLMAGKNRITAITNLAPLRKLDVLDLHSNDIRQVEGLEKLTDLRVLNLAGNRISIVQNLSTLVALTELNLRRNKIEQVLELDKLPALQRIFLSHNLIASTREIQCLFHVKLLIELSLDGNPMSESDPVKYRKEIIAGVSTLRHLDLKRVTEEERSLSNVADEQSDFEDGNIANAQPSGKEFSSEINARKNESESNPKLSPSPFAEESVSVKQVDGSGSGVQPSGLAAMARTGKVPPATQNLFDLEIIGPNEKALIAVGDVWDWVQNKRLLATVTEASLLHMKKETVLVRFNANISTLPNLRQLRLVNNGIESLQDMQLVFESMGSLRNCIENISITDNPICNCSSKLMRAFTISNFKKLKMFNEEIVTEEERSLALATLLPIINMQKLAQANVEVLASQEKYNVAKTSRKDTSIARKVAESNEKFGESGNGCMPSKQFKEAFSNLVKTIFLEAIESSRNNS